MGSLIIQSSTDGTYMSNINLNFAHFCDYASLDKGGKLNVIGIFNNITFNEFPATQAQMFFVVNIHGKVAGNYQVKIRFERTRDAALVIPIVIQDFEVTSEEKNQGFILQLNGVVFNSPDMYQIVITEGDVEVGRLSLLVKSGL